MNQEHIGHLFQGIAGFQDANQYWLQYINSFSEDDATIKVQCSNAKKQP